MATPQKPIPAPIDRFNEKMAMDARACHQISHFTHCKVFLVLCFNCCLPCLPPEAGIPLVYHGWICLKELIVHPWQLDIRYWDMIDTQLKKMPVCLCYLKTNRQCHLSHALWRQIYYHVHTLLLWIVKLISQCQHLPRFAFSLLIWQIRNPCRY